MVDEYKHGLCLVDICVIVPILKLHDPQTNKNGLGFFLETNCLNKKYEYK